VIPGDRLVCLFIENYKVGHTFQEWPLHITIVPWFRAQPVTGVLTILMQEKLTDIEPFTAVLGEEAHFGHKGQKLVNVVEAVPPLRAIEKAVRGVLHTEQAWIVAETTGATHRFRPHVTTQQSRRLQQGDIIPCQAIYVVEQMGEHKQIVDKIVL